MKTSFVSGLFLTVFAGLSLAQPLDTEASTLEARWGKMSADEAEREMAKYSDPRGHVDMVGDKIISYGAGGNVLKTIHVDDKEEMGLFGRAAQHQSAAGPGPRSGAPAPAPPSSPGPACLEHCTDNSDCTDSVELHEALGLGCPNCGTVSGHVNPLGPDVAYPNNKYCWGKNRKPPVAS